MITSNTLASAGTATLHAASVARIFAAPGPRPVLAPDGVVGGSGADEATLDDLSDADLGLDDEPERAPKPAEGDVGKPGQEPNEDGLTPGDLDPEEGEHEGEKEGEAEKEPGSLDDQSKVKLEDGNEVELGELKKGYLRQSDYTRKTQEVARDRGEVERAGQRLMALDRQTREALQIAQKILNDYIPAEPDLSLLQSNAAEFQLRKELRQRGIAQVAELQQALRKQDDGGKAMSQADQQAMIGREMAALTEKAPELRDPAKRQALLNDINTRAQAEYAYNPDELAGVTDHRAILVLRDALAYRKLLANRTNAITKVKATAPMRPAPRQAPQQRAMAGQAAAVDRARRTGSEDDVARLLTDADLGGGF